VARAVDGVEPGAGQSRGVADVVQLRGGDEVGAILGSDGQAHPAGLRRDALDVRPAVAEAGQQGGGLLLGPGRQLLGLHMATLSAGAGPGEPHEPFHQLGRLPVLGGLEVRVGPERCPAAVTVPGPARDGAHVNAG
jgi:hypothetical protein